MQCPRSLLPSNFEKVSIGPFALEDFEENEEMTDTDITVPLPLHNMVYDSKWETYTTF